MSATSAKGRTSGKSRKSRNSSESSEGGSSRTSEERIARSRARVRRALRGIARGLLLAALVAGCGGGAGGWRAKALSARTVDWKRVDGQHLTDVLATPSIRARSVSLLLCRWRLDRPIRVAWPEDATESQRIAFEQARRAWSGVVEGLELVSAEGGAADVVVAFAEIDEHGAPKGTAETGTDCVVDGGATALADPAERGRIVSAQVMLRRANVDWTGRSSPMSDDEFLGAVLHELGHALGIAGHVGSRGSVMSVEISHVRRAARRLAAGEPFREPTLTALYTVPIGVDVGTVGFDPRLRPALDLLADLARRSGWQGPFGGAGDDSARVFWRTPDGRHPGIFTYEWTAGIRGRRALDWRLSLSARAAIEAAERGERVVD